MSAPPPSAAQPVPAPGAPAPTAEQTATSTKQKAAASKSFLENHYRGMLRGLNEPSRAEVKPRSKEVKVSDFELLKLIGRGAFGEVYVCRKTDDEQGAPLRAMKRMRKVDMLRMKQIFHVRSERNVMAEATKANPWVVELQFSFQDDNYLYMVMEYTPGGDMMSWLIAKEIFSDFETKFYIAELALAVQSVHDMKYVHRDLKPDNVLMDAVGHIKLSDFGLCKRFKDDGDELNFYQDGSTSPQPEGGATTGVQQSAEEQQGGGSSGSLNEPIYDEYSPAEAKLDGRAHLNEASSAAQQQQQQTATPPRTSPNTAGAPRGNSPLNAADKNTAEIAKRQEFDSVVGSPGYIAPEILRKQKYGVNCDWWSVGVIMYEMLYGCPPFYAQENHVTQHKITNWSAYLRFPPASAHGPVSKDAIDLMRQLLCDMKDRLDWNGIKSHPFFKGIDWDNLATIPPAFTPELNDPMDTRYFPQLDDRHRKADAQHTAFMKELDPRGVLFADFGFKK